VASVPGYHKGTISLIHAVFHDDFPANFDYRSRAGDA